MNHQGNLPGRRIYLRLSVTDRCNLRCLYCRPAQDARPLSPPIAASDEELLALVGLIHEAHPIYKLRLTGGEPLLRPGTDHLVGRLRARLPEAELCMTTNAVLLRRWAEALRRAGLESLNISLDTPDAQTCRSLTRGGRLSTILDGISAAHKAGFQRIKLNTVLLRTINGSQLAELAHFAADQGCEIRFIELMPYGAGAALYAAEFLSAREALARLCENFACLGPAPASATARRHRLLVAGRELIVGFIAAVSEPFCAACDRVRLDSAGSLFACLRSPSGVDLLTPWRAGRVDRVRRRIRREIPKKSIPQGTWPSRSLVTIGG